MTSLPIPPTGALTVPPQHPRSGELPRLTSPRITRLAADLRSAAAASVLDAFWAEVAQSGTPLLEGPATTFLHRSHADLRPVLLANKFTGGWPVEQAMFQHLPGTDVHHLSLSVPADLLSTYRIGFAGSAVQDDTARWREERARRAGRR